MKGVRDILVLFSGFVRWKVTINQNVSFIDHPSGIRLLDGYTLAINWKKDNKVTICRFSCQLQLLVRFMPISWLILELRQFSFIKYWPEIWKSEIPLSEFFPIYRDRGVLGIPILTRMSHIKSYWVLQYARVIAFTVSELSRENQLGGWGVGGKTILPT